jgi:glycosyltransferase involved in cell wall biosynthesis
MKKNIAILLPYKEKYNLDKAGAASIWVKDYLSISKLKNQTLIFGNLDKKDKPLTKNFVNIDLTKTFIRKNIQYTKHLYDYHLKNKFNIIEIHNRPESLLYLIKKKISAKLIFMFHNNPQDMRSSKSINDRIFIAENTDQIYFVSRWVKDKFFEGLPFNHRNNCEILYPAIKPLKKFPKKDNLIIFSGKLNSSKGFDLYGKAVIKILDKHKSWNAIAIGNEPREKFNFNHKNFKILDWVKHDDILDYYKKASISVVPSRWLEPFGRTAMESAAYGCATITTRNGGLPETFNNELFLEKINDIELYKLIEKLIKNNIYRKRIQKKNFSNVINNINEKVSKLDEFKNHILLPKVFFNKKAKLKILHVSTFDERSDHRLFNISISQKLSKGFIRNDHDVINFSYRNYLSKNILRHRNEIINNKVINICNHYRPDLLVLGHNNFLYKNNLEKIKYNFKSKIALWYEDALGHKGEGPNWRQNLTLIENNNHYIDNYFVTTHPDEIKTIISKKKMNFLPIPVDENIENLEIYNSRNRYKDLFFALSHGVNFGDLKKRKTDEREIVINNLMKKFPKINYNFLGIANEKPKWNYDFFEELLKTKMALNLSRGKPLKYTSSNRIAALIGNGIYTFIDKKTNFKDFFNENEVGSYKDLDDLGSKIEKLKSKPNLINKYGKAGRDKYFKLFNTKKISKEIIDIIF